MQKESWRRMSLPSVDEWPGFFAAVFCGVVAVAAMNLMNGSSATSFGERAFSSVKDAAVLVAGGLTCGFIVWAGRRVFQGEHFAPQPKETMLWFACIVVILVTALRMLS